MSGVVFERLPPALYPVEAQGLFDKMRAMAQQVVPDKVAELDAWRPQLIQLFQYKLSQGWVPKKGYTTAALVQGSMALFRDYKLGKWAPGQPVTSYGL